MRTFLPTGYEPKYPYPLLVFFHGQGGNEEQIIRLAPRLSRRNYICIGLRGMVYYELHVEGASHVPDGPVIREKPTLLLLHGGPGLDHSIYKPAFSTLADVAQVVFLDHRGNGRSDSGPQ